MNSHTMTLSPLAVGRRRFELHKNLPSHQVRYSSVDISKSSSAGSPNQIAGIATSYDQGNFDTIFATKDKPEYKSSNASYGVSVPQLHSYERTSWDVQRLRDALMQKTQLSRKGSESDLSIAETIYAPEFAVGTKDPHAASRYNPVLREQAASKRIEDLKRMRAEEHNSQLKTFQRQQEYKEFLDLQSKLKEDEALSEASSPAYGTQPRYTRKQPKTTTYNPLIGEVYDYSQYLYSPPKGHLSPPLDLGIFKLPPKPSTYSPYNPQLPSPPVVPQPSYDPQLNAQPYEASASYSSPYNDYQYHPQAPSNQEASSKGSYSGNEGKLEPREEVPRKKLAGYGQYVLNATKEPLYTRRSGLGYKPTTFLYGSLMSFK